MSSLGIWLILTLLSCISAQNDTSNETLNQAQNLTDKKTLNNNTIETTTRDSGHEHEHEHKPHQHSSNENHEESTPTPPPPPSSPQPPHLRFNPPDFFPFPKLGHVMQFWRDHPDLKAIPDLPIRDTEYPQWLLAVMGGFRPPTRASTANKEDRVLLPRNRRPIQQLEVEPTESGSLDFESGALDPEKLPRQNNMEGRFESNNVPLQTETGNREFILTPEIAIQQPLLNSRIQQRRPVPDNFQRPIEKTVNPDFSPNQKEHTFFRIPLNPGFGRIQNIRNSNTQTDPQNFVIVRENRFESHQSANTPVQMVPLRHEDFRGIPVTISRSSVVQQPGILMLPVRNQNEPSHFSHRNFIRPNSPRMSPIRERFILAPPNQNRLQNPSFARQNGILIDPQFSRAPWPRVLEQDQNLERTVVNQRQAFEMPDKQANIQQNIPMFQSNRSSSLPNRPRIGTRQKRQAGFDSFDPFGMGNLFSIFPSEKEEPRNSFNWFPRDPIMSRPTHQSPQNSGIFIPNSNRRPTSRPRPQPTYPQDNWRVIPSPSSNAGPTFQGQNPQTNQGSGNNQLPKDFMIIQPQKPSSGRSNQMPWMLSNLFGGDLFPGKNDGQMWTIQSPFDQNSGTNINQPHHNWQPIRPRPEERVPQRNDQQFIVDSPVFHPSQNFPPNRGQTHINNIQPPSQHVPPPQVTPNRDQIRTHVRPQQHWRPAPQVPVQSQPQLPVAPQGTWIPRKNIPKETPVLRPNHFQDISPPHHHQPQPTEQSPSPSEAPVHHEGGHQSHRPAILPEIQKGKRKLSPSEVRHLLSLLPEFPKDINKKPTQSSPTGQTVDTTVNSTGTRHKRSVHGSFLESEDTNDGNFTRNYPGSSEQNQESPKDRRKRDIEESLIRDVVFGSYGYHSDDNYPASSFSDFTNPFLGFTAGNNHDSGFHHLWGNLFPGSGHNLNSVWNWPHHDYFMPHLGHANGHLLPPYHPSDSWLGNMHPLNHGPLPGGRVVTELPLAVPRANPNQLSYTARFRYRFGIYPGYSDYVPPVNEHEVFFFYDPNQRNRRPDIVIPFRSYNW